MGYTIPEDNTRIYVQTGMRTTPEHALQNAQAISQIVKEPEGVIVNGTQGFAKSVLRSTTKNTNANYLAKPQTQSIMFKWKSKKIDFAAVTCHSPYGECDRGCRF